MAEGLDFQRVTIRISNHFEGPNFVNGLAATTQSYTVVSDTEATLTFPGGFNSAITYVQTVSGEGFGIDAAGRYTGTVHSYTAHELGHPENGWSFQNFNTALDRLNTLVSDPAVSFEDLLLVPLEYRFIGAQFDDVFIMGSFDDIGFGRAGSDNFDGLSGNDRMFGGSGADFLTGGEGNDFLAGQSGDDHLFGGPGSDILSGGLAHDRLHGGSGDDRVLGDAGADLLRGNAGADTLLGGDAGDLIFGGAGGDAILGQRGDDLLFGQAGGDNIEGGAGNDRILGGGGANLLFGQLGLDRLTGGGGSDQLFGGSGADRLASGAGGDFLNGGIGNDRLSGNLAAAVAPDHAIDTFIFEAAFGQDVITEFEIGFDNLVLAAGITPADLTTTTNGEDVLLTVDFAGTQTILLEGVADRFDPAIDITFA